MSEHTNQMKHTSETLINKFGRFDDNANELVITTPETPRPW